MPRRRSPCLRQAQVDLRCNGWLHDTSCPVCATEEPRRENVPSVARNSPFPPLLDSAVRNHFVSSLSAWAGVLHFRKMPAAIPRVSRHVGEPGSVQLPVGIRLVGQDARRSPLPHRSALTGRLVPPRLARFWLRTNSGRFVHLLPYPSRENLAIRTLVHDGKMIGSTALVVKIHRALWPQWGTISASCLAPITSVTYLKKASPRARRVGP